MLNKKLILVAFLSIALISAIVGLILFFVLNDNNAHKGAVITSTVECSNAAKEILDKDGSAVDSAIAACLCIGITSPQQSGLGGGMIATVYIKETGKFVTINSREVAPLAARRDMYTNGLESREGGLAIAVPGELKGLYELHQKYGKLSWEEVVAPAISIAENGFKISNYLSNVFEDEVRGDKIRNNPTLSDIFINKESNEFYKKGDTVKNLRLAQTLKIIAKEGSDAFYSRSGSLTQQIVDDITDAGGIITMTDLLTFEPKWGVPNQSKLYDNRTIHTFPLPTSGNIINFMMNVFNEFKFHESSMESIRQDKSIYHVMIEIFKFGFAMRTKLGDEESEQVLQTLKELKSLEYAKFIFELIDLEQTFNETEHYFASNSFTEDHGTSQISILAPNGDAVSMTTTVNGVFASYVASDTLGIVYNNEMDDFSIPLGVSDGLLPAPANFIAPQKSPMSSMSPIIVLDENNEVQLVTGGAGGILIMTSMVQFLLFYLYLNQPLKETVEQKRLHHQLMPMRVQCENGYEDLEVLEFLISKGHGIQVRNPIVSGFASIVAISKRDGKLEAIVDPRRDEAYTFI